MSAPTVQEVLDAGGLTEAGPAVVDAVREAVVTARSATAAAVPDGSVDYLRAHACTTPPPELAEWDSTDRSAAVDRIAESASTMRVTAAASRAASLWAHSLDAGQVAELLGRHRSTISHRLHDGRLYAVYLDGRPRFPRWQFDGGAPVPGLRPVVAALAEAEADPMAAHLLLTTARDDLHGRSAVDHLAAGGDVDVVLELIRSWSTA